MSFQRAVVSRAMVVGGGGVGGLPWPLRRGISPRAGAVSNYPPRLLQATVYWANSTSCVPTCYCYSAARRLSLFFLLSYRGYETHASRIFWCCALLRPWGILYVSLQTMFGALARVQMYPGTLCFFAVSVRIPQRVFIIFYPVNGKLEVVFFLPVSTLYATLWHIRQLFRKSIVWLR